MRVESSHNVLHIIDISEDDAESLIQIFRHFIKRWHGVDGNEAVVQVSDSLLTQLKEALI